MADLDLNALPDAQQAALMRLLLHATGAVHQALNDAATAITRRIAAVADAEGAVPASAFFGLKGAADDALDAALGVIVTVLAQARRHAAAIPYGVLAAQHDAQFAGAAGAVAEATQAGPRAALAADLDDLLAAAAARSVGGRVLSGRIWALSRSALAGIESVLLEGIADDVRATVLAAKVARYLGAGADCPRWTQERLRLTPAQIAAGDPSGLVRGSPCGGAGVAYAALRLIRTEVAAVHQLAAARVAARSPWVTAVQIKLSGSHPRPDDCDAHANGGPDGGGVYPVGDQPLPPYHPDCLCYQVAVLADPATFRARRDAYLAGGADAGLESYANWLGADRAALPTFGLLALLGAALIAWLTADPDTMEAYRATDPAD